MATAGSLRNYLEWHPWRVILLIGVAFTAFSVAANEAAQFIAGPIIALGVSYTNTAIFLLTALVLLVAVTRVRVGAWAELGLTFAFLLAMMASRPMLLGIIAVSLGIEQTVSGPIELLARVPGLWAIGNVCIILAAGFMGKLIGRLIREANLLPVVAVVAAGIDIWGVYWGPVAQMTTSEEGQVVAEQFSAAIPGASAAASTGVPVLAAIGIGDFLFVAMFFAVMKRARLNQRGAFWFTFVLMLLAPAFFVLGDLLPIPTNLPGLPFIALGMIISNWKCWNFSREEVRHLIAGGLIIAIVIAVIIFIKRLTT